MKSDIAYVLLHIDCNDETNILGINYEGKSLANALVSLKHHPCTKGEIHSCLEGEGFDRKKSKLIASKSNFTIIRHDIDERKRKTILIKEDVVR